MRISFIVPALMAATALSAPASALDLCTDCYSAYSWVSGLSLVPTDRGNAGWSSDKEDGGEGSLSAGVNYDVNTAGGANYAGSAFADMSSGALHVTASQLNATSSAHAELVEFIKFDLPTGVASAQVQVSWTIEGVNEFVEGLSRAGLDTSSLTNFRIDALTDRGLNARADLDGPPIDFHFYSDQDEIGTLNDLGGGRLTLTGTFTVFEEDVYRITEALTVFAASVTTDNIPSGASSKADFGNTAYFSFILPTGVTFTSGSGQLLSNPYVPGGTGAVPEPATWAMMIGGFALVGGLQRRRRLCAVA